MGRRLVALSKGTDSITYSYDASGQRVSKTVNGVTTSFYYDDRGVLVLSSRSDGTELRFYADAEGNIDSFSYNNEQFYYVRNAQNDVIGITDSTGAFVARYTYDEWGNITSITDGQGNDVSANLSHIANINPLRYRSYFYDAETGFYYVTTRYYDSDIGRWINTDRVMGVNQDMTTYNLFVYCGNNPVCRYDVGGMFWKELISGLLHAGNDFAIAIGIDTAAVGAYFLMMEPDENGIYHAVFDCWQQYFGYNELYDFAFDLGTSMVTAKFSFSCNGCGYTIWAWKGDYINLGAGAELGIYRGYSGHRTVDTSLAMWMAMVVLYKNDRIIEYYPNEYQWWITSFNPNYLNVNANDLLVFIGVGFNDSDMYKAFKKNYEKDARWSFNDLLEMAIIQF